MDEIKKDQLKPYVVLGTGSLNRMEKSFEKLAKQNSQFADSFDNVKQDVNNIEQKLPQLTAIKKASEAMGSALTSKQAKGLMDSIKTNVIDQTAKIKTQVSHTEVREVYGFPTSCYPYNPMFNVQKKLPLFTKSGASKSLYCAGYYTIKFDKGWVKSFCPKLITIERYEYRGPFKTELEMKQALSNAKSN